MREIIEIRHIFEETWKQMRSKSFNALKRKVRKVDQYESGDYVYVWIPKLMQDKIGTRWTGPYLVEKKINDNGNLVLVNGKIEHAYNLKKAIKSPSEDHENRTEREDETLGSDEDEINVRRASGKRSTSSKYVAYECSAVAWMRPGGELLPMFW